MTDLARFLSVFDLPYLQRSRQSRTQVAAIGCGYGEECLVLLRLLPHAIVTAIERDPDRIEHLRRAAAPYGLRMRVIHANAAQSDAWAGLEIDLVIVRHPNILWVPANWMSVFCAGLQHLGGHGVLMVTLYSLAEAETVRAYMEQLNCISVAGAPYSRTPVALAGNDRYILIYRKA